MQELIAAPRGKLIATFQQLQDAGCIQAETADLYELFTGLMSATAGNPCNGCPVWDTQGSACGAWKKYHTASKHAEGQAALEYARAKDATRPHNVPDNHRFAGMNMKQIAAELGISLNEARRRKAAGCL